MNGVRLAVVLWEVGCVFGLLVALVSPVVWRWQSRPPARHRTGSRRWSGNLVEGTAELARDELARLLHAA